MLFGGCQTLTGTLTVSSQIKQLPSYCFANTGLNRIILHEEVTDIGYGTFYGCASLEELTLPISVDSAKNNGYYDGIPFYECKNVKKVTFTKGTGIGYSYTNDEYTYTPWYLSRTK